MRSFLLCIEKFTLNSIFLCGSIMTFLWVLRCCCAADECFLYTAIDTAVFLHSLWLPVFFRNVPETVIHAHCILFKGIFLLKFR